MHLINCLLPVECPSQLSYKIDCLLEFSPFDFQIIAMVVNKFGQHIFHSKHRISSILSDFLSANLYSYCILPLHSTTSESLFYTFSDHGKKYIVPVSGIVDNIHVPEKVRVYLNDSPTDVGAVVQQGDILSFYTARVPRPDLVGYIVIKCPLTTK